MDSFVAYIVTNKTNAKRYVGITKEGTERRWYMHVRDAKVRPTTALRQAIAKYGAENFTIEEVACALDWFSLQSIEKTLIVQEQTHISTGLGYNETWGGDGGDCSSGRKRSEAHKEAIRRAQTGRFVSAETRQKLREAALRNPQPPPTMTPEIIEKIRLANTGKKLPPLTAWHRARLSQTAWIRQNGGSDQPLIPGTEFSC